MMTKVAESWNDILQMSEQDLEDAKVYIARLEDEIENKSQQIKFSTGRLQEQERRIKQAEERWNDFKTQKAESQQANAELTKEISALRDELAKSQAQVETTSSKCKNYKAKINQAIAEQQELYKRSKAYYDKMVHQLRVEQENQAQRATEVDVALEDSQKKRGELRKAVEDFKAEAQEEIEQKEKQIEQLQEELLNQQNDLARERNESQQFRERLERAEERDGQVMSELDEKLGAIAELCQEAGRQGEQQASDMNLLAERLQTTNENIEMYHQTALKPQDVSGLLANLEERIFERLQPHLDAVQAYQEDVENTTYVFNTTLNDQLPGIKEVMQHHLLSTMQKPDHTAAIANGAKALDTLQKDMRRTQEICNALQQKFEEGTREEMDALQKAHRSREDDLLKDFHERFESLSNREQQLQLLMENYTSKVEQISESRMSREETQNLVQLAAGLFMDSLDAALIKEREWLAQKLSKGEEAISTLESRLHKMVPTNQPDVEGLQKDLDGEREAVVRLSDDIQKLRQESLSSEKLQKRWLHDIEQVKSLRAKLSAVQPRMQRVEGIAAKLDSINRLNGLVHSTSTYLTKEKAWVQSELEATAQGANSRSRPPSVLKADVPGRPVGDGHNAPDNDPFRDGRRVFVRSPWQDSEAPSPPPDVAQEQRRRRDAAKPRSILRFTGKASSSSNTDLPPPPVTSDLEASILHARIVKQEDIDGLEPAPEARDDTSSKGIVKQIDFEQASRPIKKSASQESQGGKSASPTENIHKISQRFIADKEISPGDLKVPALRSKRAAPDDSSRPAHPLKRTHRRNTAF